MPVAGISFLPSTVPLLRSVGGVVISCNGSTDGEWPFGGSFCCMFIFTPVINVSLGMSKRPSVLLNPGPATGGGGKTIVELSVCISSSCVVRKISLKSPLSV
jgi:hypothetical protein